MDDMARRELSMKQISTLGGLAVALLFGMVHAEDVAAETTDTSGFTGYLRADLFCPLPVTFAGTTYVTSHLANISDAPVLMKIGDLDYSQAFVHIGLPREEKQNGVWGPGTETILWCNRSRIMVSGMPPSGHLRYFFWPKRDGIIVLRDEGYARLVTLKPGWHDTKQTPAAKLSSKTRYLNMSMTPNLETRLPMLTADAVEPGKPIIFDKPKPAYAPGDRLVPFTYSDPKLVPAQPPEPPPAAPIAEHALELRVELHAEVEAGKDVTAIYLVGNIGSKPVWVVQNRMVPALATWEVMREKKVLATIDGSSQRALLDLLPARPPLLLNPGEYLTYRRVLLASTLPLKRGNYATLRAHLDVPWFLTEPQPQEEAQTQTLEASFDFKVK
jgi:hypothetical protein